MKFQMLVAVAVMSVFTAHDIFAQGMIPQQVTQQVVPGYGPAVGYPITSPGQPVVGQPPVTYPPVTTYPVQPTYPNPVYVPPSHRPQFPVYVTPDQVTGYNPYTGGWNTQNQQVDNTAYDHGRNSSQNNGTKRWVNRPIYDAHGNITGYSRGYVWNNSYTGQEHGQLENVTENSSGGEHSNIQTYSVMPSKP